MTTLERAGIAVNPKSDRDLLVELHTRLDEMTKKLDSALHDHEQRLRGLEKWLYKALGFAAALGGALGSLTQNLLNKI